MTQEEKQLLFKDLCARLPYHTIVNYRGANVDLTLYTRSVRLEDCKPYLRPMSSMTEEEKVEYKRLCVNAAICNDYQQVDYLNSNHFDYRGLIEKGLALEALEGMYNS